MGVAKPSSAAPSSQAAFVRASREAVSARSAIWSISEVVVFSRVRAWAR
ncbi:hypothetical protein [Streptomyces sp. NPDC005760]